MFSTFSGNSAEIERKQLVYFDHQNVNSLFRVTLPLAWKQTHVGARRERGVAASAKSSGEAARDEKVSSLSWHLFTRLLPAGSLLFAIHACDLGVSLLAGYITLDFYELDYSFSISMRYFQLPILASFFFKDIHYLLM